MPCASITARICVVLVLDCILTATRRTYSLLEAGQVSWAEGIRLRNNWDQVDSGAQSLHNLNVQWLQGVSSGSNEVQAGVDTEINLVHTARLLFLQHIRLMLIIQEFDNWHPRVAVVDIVSEAGGVNNGKADCDIISGRQKYV